MGQAGQADRGGQGGGRGAGVGGSRVGAGVEEGVRVEVGLRVGRAVGCVRVAVAVGSTVRRLGPAVVVGDGDSTRVGQTVDIGSNVGVKTGCGGRATTSASARRRAVKAAVALYAEDHNETGHRQNQDGEDAKRSVLHQGYKRPLGSRERDNPKGLT